MVNTQQYTYVYTHMYIHIYPHTHTLTYSYVYTYAYVHITNSLYTTTPESFVSQWYYPTWHLQCWRGITPQQ